eukprot:2011938-Karenia_brevis.AAC.1
MYTAWDGSALDCFAVHGPGLHWIGLDYMGSYSIALGCSSMTIFIIIMRLACIVLNWIEIGLNCIGLDCMGWDCT